MRELLKNPDGGEYVWRRLTYVFALPDPRDFDPAAIVLTDDERGLLRRFVDHAKRLAATTLLGANDSVRIDIPDFGGGEHVYTELSEPDVTAGFMVLLRQCYADGDEASFSKVRKILERRLYEAGDTSSLAVLKMWRKAHARLNANTLEELVQEQLIVDGKMPAQLQRPDGQMESPVVRSPASPAELLRTFWYGDQVHWGSTREALAAIQADPFESGMWELAARAAACDLAHLYLGYALLVERALSS